jgi:TetR/AcrR family transcriptional regulator
MKKSTKDRILEAADGVFVRRGTDGARMQQIADEAGVNKALLHYYFRSKAELARAVWLRIASSFVPGVFEMMASEAPLDDKIDRFVDAYLTRLSRHPYLATYAVSEASRNPQLVEAFFSEGRDAAARRMVDKLGLQIQAEVEGGRMAPVTPEQFLVTLASACLFPFVARPMVAATLGIGPKGFDAFIERRRKELPAFLKRGLRP